MNSHESGLEQEATAPQANENSPQLQRDDSPTTPSRTGPQAGDTDEPGQTPDEITPRRDGGVAPSQSPDEVRPTPGDTDQPGESPKEIPGSPA